MKKTIHLAFFLIYVSALIAGCKKQIQTTASQEASVVEDTSPAKGFSATLTDEEHVKLTEYLTSSTIIDSADFVNKINTLKSESKNKSTFQKRTASENAGTEELNAADFNTLFTYEIYQGEADYNTVSSTMSTTSNLRKGFKANMEEISQFVIRGNKIKTVVPFVAVIDKVSSSNQGRLVKIAEQLGAPPFMLPDGPWWGVYGSVGQAYLQSNATQGNTGIVNVSAMGNEIRTIVRSTSGGSKLTTEVNATIYKVGAELEAGFTIQGAENVYNNYALSGILRITYNGAGYMNVDDIPGFSYFSNLKIKQTGLLRNQ